ncbi:MAG: rhodanese-like domain-containing protein [Methanomicrobiales archaeon]|nr:rhodanese-like domain-containing protein [Methanomicrobiales archaeon]
MVVQRKSPVCRECSPEEIVVIIEKGRGSPGFALLDVRRPEEFASGCIAGAENLDFSDSTFRTEIERRDRTHTYVVYCTRGVRAARALDLMRECGFLEVYSLRGGIAGWREAGLPIEKPSG